MVVAAAMEIAVRSAAMPTAAVCAIHSCTVGTILLTFAVGVLICFLDTGSDCWTKATYTAGLFAH